MMETNSLVLRRCGAAGLSRHLAIDPSTNLGTDRQTLTRSLHVNVRSISFGGGANESSSKVSSNKFATGSNQNCGNFMTGRSSTRLHAPPGGSSEAGSLIFGGGYTASSKPAARGRKRFAQKAVSSKPGAVAGWSLS